jgi:membrane fusion protein, copper/silver efflux system
MNRLTGVLKHRGFQLGIAVAAGLFLGWALLGKGGGDAARHPDRAAQEIDAGQEKVWTCSMHPQIRQGEPGKCPICGMDLIPVTARRSSEAAADPRIYRMSPEAAALADVRTVPVEFAASTHEVRLSGRIAVNEQSLRTVTASFPGRIEKLYVNFTGQAVTRGEKLATLYSPELAAARQELLEAAKIRSTDPTLYRAARERLRLWKLTEGQIDAIETAEAPRPEFDVLADLSGVVLDRRVTTGDYVTRGSVLFEIADLGNVWVLLDAYESDLPWLAVGGKAEFSVASLPGRTFTSTIRFIDPVVNPRTRSVSVRAEASNPGLLLKPDMFVTARIRTSPRPEGKSLLVPVSAVLWTGPRSVVYVKISGAGEDPAFEMREVTLGPRAGDRYVIAEGMRAGEEVVVNGAFAVDAAAQLAGNYSMMNRPVPRPGGVDAPAAFMEALSGITDAYLGWKNALVEGDAVAARRLAGTLHHAVDAADAGVLSGEALAAWREHGHALFVAVTAAAGTGDLDRSRKVFQPASDALIALLDVFGSPRGELNVDWCPMADDDRGAYWLSETEDVLNPYFGEAMLRCGERRRFVPPAGAPQARPRAPSGHEGHSQ